jgi:hypothetical protein
MKTGAAPPPAPKPKTLYPNIVLPLTEVLFLLPFPFTVKFSPGIFLIF